MRILLKMTDYPRIHEGLVSLHPDPFVSMNVLSLSLSWLAPVFQHLARVSEPGL